MSVLPACTGVGFLSTLDFALIDVADVGDFDAGDLCEVVGLTRSASAHPDGADADFFIGSEDLRGGEGGERGGGS